MQNYRLYGKPPYTTVVVHGGPGAPGEMKPVALELASSIGVIEPLQTAKSIDGQIEELKNVIEENTTYPVYLIGWSWGAWLAYLLTAKHQHLVKKLILIGSGPFESSYAKDIMSTRLSRLTALEQTRVGELSNILQSGKVDPEIFSEFGALMDKADSYSSLPHSPESIEFQPEIYESVWQEADELRKSGKLLELGRKLLCPVVAIHGDYDPHPADGVRLPLAGVIKDFRFLLLNKCGHHPWFEKYAKKKFYQYLKSKLR